MVCMSTGVDIELEKTYFCRRSGALTIMQREGISIPPGLLILNGGPQSRPVFILGTRDDAPSLS